MLNAEAVHKRACRVLPEVLATSGVLLEDASPSGLAALLFPLRRKSAGSLMFHLSSATMDAMAQDPLRYLAAATLSLLLALVYIILIGAILSTVVSMAGARRGR